MWQTENAIALVDPVAVLLTPTNYDRFTNSHQNCLATSSTAAGPSTNPNLREREAAACFQAALYLANQDDGGYTTAADVAAYRKVRRNDVVGRLITASDQACEKFTQQLNTFQSETNFLAGTVTTMLAGAAAIFTPAGTARALAGAAGIASGTRAEFNADLFYQQIVPTLRKAIETSRGEALKALQDNMQKDALAYPMSWAFAEVIRYNGVCSLVAAEATMAEKLVLASHPGLIEFNRSAIIANAGRQITQYPEKFVSLDQLNPDGSIKLATQPGGAQPSGALRPVGPSVSLSDLAAAMLTDAKRLAGTTGAGGLTIQLANAAKPIAPAAAPEPEVKAEADKVRAAADAFVAEVGAEVKTCQARIQAADTTVTQATIAKRRSEIATLHAAAIAVRDAQRAYAGNISLRGAYVSAMLHEAEVLATLTNNPSCKQTNP